MELPFLDAVRNHPKTEVIRITEENREEMYHTVLEKIKEIL
jgi:nucleoside-triphosphatase THEP1